MSKNKHIFNLKKEVNRGYILHDSYYLHPTQSHEYLWAEREGKGGHLHGVTLEVALQLHDLQFYQNDNCVA
jgi:hypothetical protein